MDIIAIKDAFEAWKTEVMPAVIEQYGKDDYPALSESWNNYTDSLCKDGQLNDLQYQYCPAWDDDMPEYDGAYILDAMGVSIASIFVSERPDTFLGNIQTGTNHYRVLVKRGNKDMTVFYSMGPAYTSEPDAEDVFNSLLMDTSDIEDCSFEEWAENYGYDTDSRRAERCYEECQKILLNLKAMFSASELDDLRELFADH